MSLGVAPPLGLLGSSAAFCAGRVSENSIYALLHREGCRLFPDALFADLFGSRAPVGAAVGGRGGDGAAASGRAARTGRPSTGSPSTPGGGTRPGWRLGRCGYGRASRTRCWWTCASGCAGSERPDRVFEVALDAARQAGLVGRRRVLDSTPLYDAVATMDTVTLIRSAIRGLLAAADADLSRELRARAGAATMTTRRRASRSCDWDDAAAREALIDSLARDGYALLAALEGREPARAGGAGRWRCWPRCSARTSNGDDGRQLPHRPAGGARTG